MMMDKFVDLLSSNAVILDFIIFSITRSMTQLLGEDKHQVAARNRPKPRS